jgi:hypothetical protein
MDTQVPTPAKKLLLGSLVLVGIPALVLALVEGLSSGLLLLRDVSRPIPSRSPNYIAYDTLLGWIGRPGFRTDSMWAPGIRLRVNAQGFRSNVEFSRALPAGRRRVICSGDSFTFGWGVDDTENWCALLASAGPRLETLNLGVSGYGVDQAYLRYRRDGVAFDHHVHVFAFITDDFKRMRGTEFGGLGKPVLERRGDTLRARNVPVPGSLFEMPRLAAHLHLKRAAFARLRVAQLARALRARIGTEPPTDAELDSLSWHLSEAVFIDLAALNRQKQSRLIAVLLPSRGEWEDTSFRWWSRRIEAAAAANGFHFLDLAEAYRRLPGDSARPLFFSPDDRRRNHLTPTGNRWVVDHLREHLGQ